MTTRATSPQTATQQGPPASRGFRITAWITGVVGLLLLGTCVVLGVYSWFDTSSSTAVLGVVFAFILAVPVVLSLSLLGAGLLSHRRHPGTGFGLVLAAAIVLGIFAGLVGLQLLLGS